MEYRYYVLKHIKGDTYAGLRWDYFDTLKEAYLNAKRWGYKNFKIAKTDSFGITYEERIYKNGKLKDIIYYR